MTGEMPLDSDLDVSSQRVIRPLLKTSVTMMLRFYLTVTSVKYQKKQMSQMVTTEKQELEKVWLFPLNFPFSFTKY